jgi:tRNA1Val (adenine37-N6)-methyltransferase
MSGWTTERPARGVEVHQPARGFRYGAEAFWMVGLALEAGEPRSAVDLGTGSGIMAWLLAARGVSTIGVELREEWREGWARSARGSEVAAPRWVIADVRSWRPAEPVELVVCNPPFFPAGAGPEPVDPWKRAARFEGEARVEDFARAAVEMLGPRGRAYLTVPVDREASVRRGAADAVRGVVEVGARRVILELGARAVERERERVSEGSARVAAWYARARGGEVTT